MHVRNFFGHLYSPGHRKGAPKSSRCGRRFREFTTRVTNPTMKDQRLGRLSPTRQRLLAEADLADVFLGE